MAGKPQGGSPWCGGLRCPWTCPFSGAFERLIGIPTEHHGDDLPSWLNPRQVVVAAITRDADGYTRETQAVLNVAGFRTERDFRNEKASYLFGNTPHAKVPVLLVAGWREAEDRHVAVERAQPSGYVQESRDTPSQRLDGPREITQSVALDLAPFAHHRRS